MQRSQDIVTITEFTLKYHFLGKKIINVCNMQYDIRLLNSLPSSFIQKCPLNHQASSKHKLLSFPFGPFKNPKFLRSSRQDICLIGKSTS